MGIPDIHGHPPRRRRPQREGSRPLAPLSGPLEVHIVARGEGGFHVERHNTETGRTLPLDGAPDAGFASLPEANAFLRRSFATDEGGNVIPEAKSPTRTRAAETDPLMLLIQAEGGMRPVQRDIAEIGRIARAKDKGMRGLARDTGNRGDYDGVPLL
ncbi:MAG TPA: hypothetical protein PLA50_12565, partial [Bacteroidia bacterium]|nr:hypothetical protein [Bacteroidia bacterium]